MLGGAYTLLGCAVRAAQDEKTIHRASESSQLRVIVTINILGKHVAKHISIQNIMECVFFLCSLYSLLKETHTNYCIKLK